MSIIKGIKVGTTDITSTYVNGNNRSDTKQLEVTAVDFQDVSGSISTPDDTVYTGSAITPTPTVTVVLDGVVTVLDLGIDYTLSYSNNINAGTATVTATGIGNYSGTISKPWIITGAELTVISPDQYYDYDGLQHGAAVTVTPVNNQTVTIRYGTTSGTYNLSSVPQIRNVSDSKIIYFKVTAPNHIDYTGSYQLVVNKLTATLVWGVSSWTYDGEVHSTTCVVGNKISGDNCVVTLSGNSITNIGSTTVRATGFTGTDGGNYTLPSGVTHTISVIAGLFVKISGVWTPVKKVYKKVGTSWELQDLRNAFNSALMYKKMN